MGDLTVIFPEPCGEQWEGMNEVGCNRHCGSCDRIVYDLSNLTVDEAENLLDSDERICMRAEVLPEGNLRTRNSKRAMLIGASALLVAACQTTPGGRVENGFTLTGQTWAFPNAQGSRITNENGESAILRIDQSGRFKVKGLRPGTYELTVVDMCGRSHAIDEVIVVDSDVDLGRFDVDNSCIIVGRLVRDTATGQV